MAVLAGRRKEGDTLLDILKGRLASAGFSHYKVRQRLIRSVLTENTPKWSTCCCSYESNHNTVETLSTNPIKETLDVQGTNEFAQQTG